MSFQTLAGEENNFIHNKAFVTGKSIEDTLHDVAHDVLPAHSRITKTLEATDRSHSWRSFVNGYL
ncbi:hypothetical protein CVT25_002874 [Psilocybe cyanescens]|uniref:Uncharacterized protein n=1 Tax=Psilocybe cyanescens TaxID=93625 RepID=A0A409WKZ3_PSICY|nr:hypothetical protein CVT25_002874 [Psilocybe cyanescens]